MADARVLIAVCHPLISDALKFILEHSRFSVAGSASLARSVIAQAQLLRPEIVILDSQLVLNAGEGLVGRLRAVSPRTKVVLLAESEEDEEPVSVAEGGVVGRIYKDAPAESLLTSLRKVVASNGHRTSPQASSSISGTRRPPGPTPSLGLILWVLALVAQISKGKPGGALMGNLASHPGRSAPTQRVGLQGTRFPTPLANLLAIAISFAAFAPLARTYLSLYPPAGIDFIHGVFYVAFLRQHPGLWISLWNSSWLGGIPFARGYGVLGAYMALPFAVLLGDGPGLQAFLIFTQVVFVLFTYLLLKELSGRYIVAVALTILVSWSANLHYEFLEAGLTAQTSAQMYLPICLYVLVKYIRTGNRRLLVAVVVLTGLAFMTHPIVGSLIAALLGVILLCVGDKRGAFLSSANVGRLLFFGVLLALIVGAVGAPLISPLLIGLGMARDGTAPTVHIRPLAPIDMLLTTNPVLLAVTSAMLGLWIFRVGRNSEANRFGRELVPFVVATAFLEAAQFALAQGLNPVPFSLSADRTWWMAPLLFAAISALIARRLDFSAGLASFGGRKDATRPTMGFSGIVSTALVIAALVGPLAGWLRIESGIKQTELDPPGVVDVLMNPQNVGKESLVPPSLDAGATDVRVWTQNARITMWWSILNSLPITGGYFDPGQRPWVDWRNLMQMAVNGSLVNEPLYTIDAAKNVANFLIDWFAIRYIVTYPAGHYDVSAASYLMGPETVSDSVLVNGLRTVSLKPELADPIISGTNVPTVLVIGDETGYETVVRAIGLANLGPRKVITIRGPKRIDEMSLEEVSRFDAVVLYNYEYSDAGRAFGTLEEYVRSGGGLFIETGSLVRDSDSRNLPSIFPVTRVRRGSIGTEWALEAPRNPAFGDINTLGFSPLMYEDGPWALSYASGPADLRPWAQVLLGQAERPLMAAGSLDKGRVVWSGINLPYHVTYYVNLTEAALLADAIRWIAPQKEPTPTGYSVSRPSSQSATVTGSGFKGVLFKENAISGWSARLVTDKGSSDLNIYRAGPDFMYVSVPGLGPSEWASVHFRYDGRQLDWVLFWISTITIILSLEYSLLGGRVLVNRLAVVANPVARPCKRLLESMSRLLVGEEE